MAKRATKKDLIEYLYQQIIDDVVEVFEKQKGYTYPNTLIELGNQVACGVSMHWHLYEELAKDIASNHLQKAPANIVKAMWDNTKYIDEWYDDYRDVIYEDDVAEEVFQRVCMVAEDAYYEYEEDDEEWKDE